MATDEQTDSDKQLSMVDEALVAGTIANTNGLLVILAKLVSKGVFDRSDLQSFSRPLRPAHQLGVREYSWSGSCGISCNRAGRNGRGFLSGREGLQVGAVEHPLGYQLGEYHEHAVGVRDRPGDERLVDHR